VVILLKFLALGFHLDLRQLLILPAVLFWLLHCWLLWVFLVFFLVSILPFPFPMMI